MATTNTNRFQFAISQSTELWELHSFLGPPLVKSRRMDQYQVEVGGWKGVDGPDPF